jgi:peptide/nickel transport system substrate-binding protein
MAISRKHSGAAGSVVLLILISVLVVASAGGAATEKASGTKKVKGGTAYFAEPPQAVPNYIFPFMSLAFFSTQNIPEFQQLMYRPLYWFGNGSNPTLNESLSLASNPKYSKGNRVVSFKLKHYKWSNGESVTAQDVLFWMNMMKVEKLNWAAYAPGTLPDNVKSIGTKSDGAVTFTLTGSVNPYWFTYNGLSQITPMPMAWDIAKTGQKAGSQACGKAAYGSVTVKTKTSKKGTTVVPVSAAAKSCAAVWTYLSQQSGYSPANPKAPNNSLETYATNPLWQVVDGPWHLSAFNSTGYAAFKPNPHYSGPVKPSLVQFVELPYTSSAAEFNALVGGKVTVGYLPFEDVTSPGKSSTVPGSNNPRLSGKFDMDPWYSWSMQYAPFNFNSTGNGGQAGKIFKQLYFRQAFQLLIDQPLYLDKVYKNYGVPTYGPVPVMPKNDFSTAFVENNPYDYDVKKATSLLSSHGWKVNPNGVTTCSSAAKCGVPAGTKLSFTMEWASGQVSTQQLVQAEQASLQAAGIKLTLRSASFNTVYADAIPCSGKGCTWEIAFWGGWTYAPDYYPSGEFLFQTGAGSNSGSYSDPKADKLIHKSVFGTGTLATYENYMAVQLPVVYQPNPAYQITEVQSTLKGATPQNPLLSINPENWYFTK